MLCFFCDCCGINQKEYQVKSKTIDSKVYSKMLVSVETAIKTNRRNEFYRKNIMFHQDNSSPDASASISGIYKYSNGVFCDTHHAASKSVLRIPIFISTCRYILLMLCLILLRTSEMKFDLFLDSRPPMCTPRYFLLILLQQKNPIVFWAFVTPFTEHNFKSLHISKLRISCITFLLMQLVH